LGGKTTDYFDIVKSYNNDVTIDVIIDDIINKKSIIK
jgi:hypothetical protein